MSRSYTSSPPYASIGVLWDCYTFNIQSCLSRNAKTLGLQHLQFMDVDASIGPPNCKLAMLVYHRTTEWLVEMHTIPDTQAFPRVKEAAKYIQSLSRLSPCLDVRHTDQPCIKGYTKFRLTILAL
jgi:hypothetical protein